jgi:tetratricopeptide (TPR) repeat protein
VVLHSFFSTSLDRDVALCQFDAKLRRDSAQQNVLFEIDIDTRRQIKSRPYAKISHLSTKQDEEEVLFTPGVRFRIYDVSYDENINCWIVKMLLASNDDKDILVIGKTISERKRLKSLFNALFYDRKCLIPGSECEAMFTYFDDLLEPHDKTWARIVHRHVEGVEAGIVNPTLTQSKYSQALAMWSNFMTNDGNSDELNCFIDISQLHKDFAYSYEMSDDYNMREKHLDQAVDSLHKALQRASTDTERTIIEDKLADLYNEKLSGNDKKKRKNLSRAIQFKERILQHSSNFYSADDEAIVPRLIELAKLYDSIDEHDVALRYFQRGLDIHRQQVQPYYSSIITICDRMVKINMENKRDAKSALSCQLIGHEYSLKQRNMDNELQSLNKDDHTNDNTVAESYVTLGVLYTKLSQYDLARENLTKASKLYTYYDQDDKAMKLADIEKKLADICEALRQYSPAYQHLTAALEWYKKAEHSLKGIKNVGLQNGEEHNSLRLAMEAADRVRLGGNEIPEKIAIIERKLRKMKKLLKKGEK